MLNGKFFTGLPPKMLDRGGASTPNRLESHIFWPDDTKVETAAESRIKRRNSVQLANTERPLYEKQISQADNDVDTKKRFSREFSQSSIQFYDNLNDNRSNSRRKMLANRKTDIAENPTKAKLQLPESVVDEAYTTAKKKQAYTSKIEFYDYVNDREEEPQFNRNNLRKPKMDMNDKREMELNSKNSPKLQVKRDVRSLSEEKEQRKINNREVRTAERSVANNKNDNFDLRERSRVLNNEERYLQNRRSIEPRNNVSPKRGLARATNNYEQRYSSDREMYGETAPVSYERRKPVYYENSEEMRGYRGDAVEYENRRFSQRDYDNLEDNSSYRRNREEPTNMNRKNTKQYYDAPDERDYSQEYQGEEEIRNRMRTVHLKSPPPRKQYYPPEEYYDDEPQHYYKHNDQVKTPTRSGSAHQRFDLNDREASEVDLPYENYNNYPRFNKNNSPINKINNQIQQRPVATPTSPPPSEAAESSSGATNSQKHLRSSLCFNNGEIIGENVADRSPTSTQYPTQRRNARSSATQRVSVGLPD